MSDRDNILDVDFDAQMQGLFQQAERAIGERASIPASTSDLPEAAVAGEPAEAPDAPEGVLQMPGPDGTADLDASIRGLDTVAKTIGETVQALPKMVTDLRALLEMKNGVSHSMFSALHEELKSYKDGFLLQSVYRPIIRDLVSVYDDLTEIHRQITEAIGEGAASSEESAAAKKMLERMRTMEMNLGHNVEFILEVLARLDVTQLPISSGKLDKTSQRAVAVETTDNPDDHTLVVRMVKRGFLWHERVLRPEEVVVKRFREPAHNPPPAIQIS